MKETKRKKIERKKAKARILYSQGFTTREIGKFLDRSKTWVSWYVKDLQKQPAIKPSTEEDPSKIGY